MKTRVLSTLAALAFLAGSIATSRAAERVEFSDLPQAVQRTVNEQAGASGIASIQRLTRHGIPLYEVRLSQPGNARPVYISETGTLLNLDQVVASRPAQEGSRKATFSDLPVPVQNALRGQAGNARIEDIDVVTKHGETTYNAAFKRDGKTVELWLDANGNVLNQGQTPVTTAIQRVPLAAASKVDPDDLPNAVRRTVSTYAQGAQIEDVDKGTLQGRPVYEVAFKRDGRHVELRVAEDGTLVRDDGNDRFLASIGQAPGSKTSLQTLEGERQPSWASAPARARLANTSKISFRELPSEVRETLRAYSGDARIEDIDKGTVNGTPVYQAAFKHNGRHVELRLTENGSLVRDAVNEQFITQFRRSASSEGVGRAPSWQILTGGQASTPDQLTNLKSVRFSDTPPAVQSALRGQAGLSAIDSVRQGKLNGETVYEAFFTKDRETKVVRVNEDGSLVR